MLKGLVVCSPLGSFLVEIEVSFLESITEAEPECFFCLSLQLFHYRGVVLLATWLAQECGLTGCLAGTSSQSPVGQLLWL